MGKNQHVVQKDDQWAVKGENNTRNTSLHNTQQDAFNAARDIAKNQQSEVLIHNTDGEIRAKHSYGNDPFPPKG